MGLLRITRNGNGIHTWNTWIPGYAGEGAWGTSQFGCRCAWMDLPAVVCLGLPEGVFFLGGEAGLLGASFGS